MREYPSLSIRCLVEQSAAKPSLVATTSPTLLTLDLDLNLNQPCQFRMSTQANMCRGESGPRALIHCLPSNRRSKRRGSNEPAPFPYAPFPSLPSLPVPSQAHVPSYFCPLPAPTRVRLDQPGQKSVIWRHLTTMSFRGCIPPNEVRA
jgi:hypothetical protein